MGVFPLHNRGTCSATYSAQIRSLDPLVSRLSRPTFHLEHHLSPQQAAGGSTGVTSVLPGDAAQKTLESASDLEASVPWSEF